MAYVLHPATCFLPSSSHLSSIDTLRVGQNGMLASWKHEISWIISDSAPHLSICVRPSSMPQSNKAPREPTVLIMPCSWANAVKCSFSRETTRVAALNCNSVCAVYINQIPKFDYINSIILLNWYILHYIAYCFLVKWEWTTAATKVYPEPVSQHASLILVHPFWVSNCHELILRTVWFLCIANGNSHLLASKDTINTTWKLFNKPHLAKTSIDESIHEGWC